MKHAVHGPKAIRFAKNSVGRSGVMEALPNPTLELHDGSGNFITTNDDWKEDSSPEAELEANGLAPTDDREAAIDAILVPRAHTAIVAGKDCATGIGLVEVYNLE
jgi:hypothetical protein